MHRIDTPGATATNRFQNGNPFANIASTIVGAKWLNAVQTELATVIEAQGLTLTDTDETQLQAALLLLFAEQAKSLLGYELDFTAGAALTGGDGLLLGDLFGVVKATVGSGLPAVLILTGIHNLPKTAADDISVGELLYWNNGAGEVTVSSSGNHLIGASTVARAAATTSCDVRLNGTATAAS